MYRPAMCLLLAVLTAVFLIWPPDPIYAAGSGAHWNPDELNWYGISQRRINDTRADAGLDLLAADGYLWSLAHERARDMLDRRYLAATTPEGLDAGAYMAQDGARYAQWVEFQAADDSGRAQDAVAWAVVSNLLNDAPGRAAVLGDFDRFGVAMAETDGRRVFVIMLGKSAPPEIQVTERPAPAPGDIVGIITAAANRHGVDPDFMIKIARCESSLNPRAYNRAGPYIGLFQFLPATFYRYGGQDIYSAEDQSETTARMLARGLWRHWECAYKVKGLL